MISKLFRYAILPVLLLAGVAYADSSIVGDNATVTTTGNLATGQVNIATQNAGPIQFFTNKIKRGYIDGSTGALTGFTFGSLNLANNTYLTASNAAGSGTLNLLKADATDDTVLDTDTGDVLKLNIAGTTEATLDNDKLTLSGAAFKIIPGATSIAFRNTADAADTIKILDSGTLVFGTAASTIVGGATSFQINNAANSLSNLLILDDGSTTLRASLKFSQANAVIIGGGTYLQFNNAASSFANFKILDGGDVAVSRGKFEVTGGLTYAAITGASGQKAIFGSNNNSSETLALAGNGANAVGTKLVFFKTRSTTDFEASTIVSASDVIGELDFRAANGTTYNLAAKMLVTVDGAPGASNDMPTAFEFQVSPDGSATPATALTIASTGIVSLPNNANAYFRVAKNGYFGMSTLALPIDIEAGVAPYALFAGADVTSNASLAIAGRQASANGARIDIYKTRASDFEGNTIVNASDEIGIVDFWGANGTTYTRAARIIAKVDGTPGAADMPGSLDFQTTVDGSTTMTTALLLSNNKLATFAGDVTTAGTLKSTRSTDLGWAVVDGADNTACNSICTNAAVFGFNVTAGNVVGLPLNPSDATADVCLCAGSS